MREGGREGGDRGGGAKDNIHFLLVSNTRELFSHRQHQDNNNTATIRPVNVRTDLNHVICIYKQNTAILCPVVPAVNLSRAISYPTYFVPV